MRISDWSSDVCSSDLDKTFADAMDEFARKVSEGRDGAHWEIIRLNALARYPIAKRRLEALAANDFADWRDARLTPVKPATVAREMNLLRSVPEVARREDRKSGV